MEGSYNYYFLRVYLGIDFSGSKQSFLNTSALNMQTPPPPPLPQYRHTHTLYVQCMYLVWPSESFQTGSIATGLMAHSRMARASANSLALLHI